MNHRTLKLRLILNVKKTKEKIEAIIVKKRYIQTSSKDFILIYDLNIEFTYIVCKLNLNILNINKVSVLVLSDQ